MKFRRIDFLTKEEKNKYIDGHVMIEVFYNNKWRLYDFSRGCYFKDIKGVTLNAFEIINKLEYKIENFNVYKFDIRHSHHKVSSNFIEDYYLRPDGIIRFYKRIFGDFLIEEKENQILFR